jgi:hypothetical protein
MGLQKAKLLRQNTARLFNKLKNSPMSRNIKLALTVGSIVSFIGCVPLNEGIRVEGGQKPTQKQEEVLKGINSFSKDFYKIYPYLEKYKVPLEIRFVPDEKLSELMNGNRVKWIFKEENAGIIVEKEKSRKQKGAGNKDKTAKKDKYVLMLPESGDVSQTTIAVLIAKFNYKNSPEKE